MRTALLLVLMASGATTALAQDRNPHVALGGVPCSSCHAGDSWREVSFDHRRTGFPLRGRHLTVPCSSCHDVRDFRGAVKACVSCHEDAHRGDAGPTCVQCHSESGWRIVNAQDAHARSRLPDLGVHASLRCDDCHRQDGVQPFHGRVTPCVGCHQATYDATTNPAHAAIGLARNCDGCHQMATWSFALFTQHDALFAIYSGGHAGTWSACSSCHTTAADYKVYTCVTCHTDPATTPRHSGIPGYQWASTACLTCHPRGGAGDMAFHEAIFAIRTGPHASGWTSCTDCHTNPADRKVVNCLGGACHAQSTTDPLHNLIPGYGYTSAQCLTCHPDGRAGNFPQHDAVFPIYSGTHQGRWSTCASCHTVPGDHAQFTCTGAGCHSQTQMDSRHSGIRNYQPQASACLACHPGGRSP